MCGGGGTIKHCYLDVRTGFHWLQLVVLNVMIVTVVGRQYSVYMSWIPYHLITTNCNTIQLVNELCWINDLLVLDCKAWMYPFNFKQKRFLIIDMLISDKGDWVKNCWSRIIYIIRVPTINKELDHNLSLSNSFPTVKCFV